MALMVGIRQGQEVTVRAPLDGERGFLFPQGHKTARARVIKVPRGRQNEATRIRVEYQTGQVATVPRRAVSAAR